MIIAPVTVRNLLGLHARAANVLAQSATQFKSRIEIEDPASCRRADAKSIMQLLMMAAGRGTGLNLHIEGSDQDEAITALTLLFNNGFGEPCE
jgi:phosphocarrier protein